MPMTSSERDETDKAIEEVEEVEDEREIVLLQPEEVLRLANCAMKCLPMSAVEVCMKPSGMLIRSYVCFRDRAWMDMVVRVDVPLAEV